MSAQDESANGAFTPVDTAQIIDKFAEVMLNQSDAVVFGPYCHEVGIALRGRDRATIATAVDSYVRQAEAERPNLLRGRYAYDHMQAAYVLKILILQKAGRKEDADAVDRKLVSYKATRQNLRLLLRDYDAVVKQFAGAGRRGAEQQQAGQQAASP